MPVTSPGIRSGVNWMRLKRTSIARARVETSSVLASPGTPCTRQWPRANTADQHLVDHGPLADDDLAHLAAEGGGDVGQAAGEFQVGGHGVGRTG